MLPTSDGADLFAAEILAVPCEPKPATPDSVGEIVFADGTAVAVDREIVLGRAPRGLEGEQLLVTVHHDAVSRSHAQITVTHTGLLLTDLGSRNGTWVYPPGHTTPTQLTAGTPHILEAGTTVHLAGPEASFTYRH